MKATLFTLAVAFAAAGVSVPVFARDALPQATQQVLALKDGSTLYVFKDGKMAKEDRYGRAAYLKQGEVLELADGRKVTAVGNEVARLDVLLTDQGNAYLEDPCTVERSVFVPTDGVSVVDFDLDAATTERLHAAGVAAGEEFLAGWDFAAHVRRCRRVTNDGP